MKKIFFSLILLSGLLVQSQSVSVTYLVKGVYPDNPEFNFEDLWILQVDKGISLFSPLNKIEDQTKIKEFEVNGEIQNAPSTIYNNYDIYYNNQKSNNQIVLRHFLGKDYLIEDIMVNKNWAITNETKMIDNYKCRLAITNQNGYPLKAWFTDEISISLGPKNLNGLPGLIMEYSVGFTQVIAKEINFNKDLTILPPNKGLKITKDKFSKIQEKAYQVPKEETTVESNGNTTITITKYSEVEEIKPKN